jgi:hypothetical protein
MMIAAKLMTVITDNVLELTGECSIEEIINNCDELKYVVDPTGIFLNSLIVPIKSSSSHLPTNVKFAHRLFQEYFLAMHILINMKEYQYYKFPSEILDHIHGLQAENVLYAV